MCNCVAHFQPVVDFALGFRRALDDYADTASTPLSPGPMLPRVESSRLEQFAGILRVGSRKVRHLGLDSPGDDLVRGEESVVSTTVEN